METAACKRTSASKLGADVRVHIGGPPVFFSGIQSLFFLKENLPV